MNLALSVTSRFYMDILYQTFFRLAGPAVGGKAPIFVPKNGNARPPRPRAGRESIDADQLMSVNLAASATGAVDRAPAF